MTAEHEADSAALLEEYVRRHDAGVRERTFASLLTLFGDDAELRFIGVPLGPFRGREAIEDAFRRWPPSGELGTVAVDPGSVGSRTGRATFGGDDVQGELLLTARDGRIETLVIDVSR